MRILIVIFSVLFTFSSYGQYNKKDLKKIITTATKSIEENPQNHSSYYLRAFANWELENYDEAIFDLKKTIKYNPDNVKAYVHLADIYSIKRDFNEASKYYDLAIKNGHKIDAKYAVVLGTNFYFIQNYTEAIKYLNMALDEDPKIDDTAHNNLAWAYIYTNKIDLAIENFKFAYKQNPDFINNVNNLGYAYYLDNKLELAKEYILKAKKMDSKNSFVYRNLGLIYKKEMNKKKACINYKKALSLNIVERWDASYIEELKEYCEN